MTMNAIGYFSIINPAYRTHQHSDHTHKTAHTVHTGHINTVITPTRQSTLYIQDKPTQ